jgi:hypothetical protein
MTRPQLRLAAVVLIVLIVVVAASALDHLPGNLRAQIDSERAALSTSQSQLAATRTQIDEQIQSAPDLFSALPFGAAWPGRFNQAEGELRSATSDVDELNRLEKRDSHSDRGRVETLLASEKKLRAQALSDASAVQSDAAHWVDASKNLPRELSTIERNYQAIHNFDFAPVTAAVQRAETDWPEKKSDLEARLAAAHAVVTDTDRQWQATAEARQQAAAEKVSGAGAAALLTFEDSLQTATATLPKTTDELKTLSAQLYTSWDKLLVDMKSHGNEYQQEIRTVRTKFPDATAKSGDVSSDDQWTLVPHATYDAMRNDLGMAIEHKPEGKYDSEAEHVAQPAGLAYVAPPSQGSNQYGYWDHRDGRDFWVFYGQYALLRDLLFNHRYVPFDRYEWEDYRNYSSRGQTYYGHDTETNAPKYGSQGTATQKGYSSSNYAHSGGFRDSQYASKSGSYRNTPYASPSVRDPGSDHSPKTFGHSEPSAPRATPAPRPVRPMSPPRSPGRTFGRRH